MAADFGHQADAVVRAARERSQHQEKPVNSFDRVRESLTFSRDKNFEREAVVDERALIRDGLRRGMGEITHGQVRANLSARLASGEFQIVDRPQGVPGRQFTTAKTIEAEHEIIRRMREGQNHAEPVLSRPDAIALADQHRHLNHAQKSVIEDVLSSPDRIQGIQGFAGSGKTTALTAIRSFGRDTGLSGRRPRPDLPRFAPTERGRSPRGNSARLPRARGRSRRGWSKSASTSSMNQALPAPTRCASSLRGLVLMTVCS